MKNQTPFVKLIRKGAVTCQKIQRLCIGIKFKSTKRLVLIFLKIIFNSLFQHKRSLILYTGYYDSLPRV